VRVRRRRATRALVATVVLVAAVVGGVAVADSRSPDLDASDVARLVPAGVTSVDVVDWSSVRGRLGVSGDDLLVEASRRDLATRSTLVSSDVVVNDGLGWSPSTVRWEAFVQTGVGTGVLIGVPGSPARTEELLREVGYVEADGTWSIEVATLRADGAATPGTFVNVRLLDGGVVAASSEAAVVDQLADVAAGRTAALADDPGALHVWARAGGLDAFALQDAAAGCASTDPAEAGQDVAAQAEVAVTAAGSLRPYRWLLRGLGEGPDGRLGEDRFEVAMAYEAGPAAAEQAEVRARLATGPFIGQSGTVEQSIELRRHLVDGDVAVLDFQRQEAAVSLMAFSAPFVAASC